MFILFALIVGVAIVTEHKQVDIVEEKQHESTLEQVIEPKEVLELHQKPVVQENKQKRISGFIVKNLSGSE